LKKIPNSTIKDVPYPAELKIGSGARIVNISAAGMYVIFFVVLEELFM
jgi:SCF-associated factor 1